MRRERQHGTRSRYVVGCRCEDCTRANRDYARGRYGFTQSVDPSPYTAVMSDLYQRGETIATIAEQTGLCWQTVEAIMFGERRWIYATTAEKARRAIELLPA